MAKVPQPTAISPIARALVEGFSLNMSFHQVSTKTPAPNARAPDFKMLIGVFMMGKKYLPTALRCTLLSCRDEIELRNTGQFLNSSGEEFMCASAAWWMSTASVRPCSRAIAMPRSYVRSAMSALVMRILSEKLMKSRTSSTALPVIAPSFMTVPFAKCTSTNCCLVLAVASVHAQS